MTRRARELRDALLSVRCQHVDATTSARGVGIYGEVWFRWRQAPGAESFRTKKAVIWARFGIAGTAPVVSYFIRSVCEGVPLSLALERVPRVGFSTVALWRRARLIRTDAHVLQHAHSPGRQVYVCMYVCIIDKAASPT